MAIESYYIRNKIKYHITQLKKLMLLEDIPDEKVDQYYSNVEIHIIEMAALTRKLRDLGKLPDNTLEDINVNLIRYTSQGPDSQRSYVDMEKEYDLVNPSSSQLPLSRIVDLIIHSYVLQASGDEGYAFSHILVTSDHTRLTGLFSIDLKDLNDACLRVCVMHTRVQYIPYTIR